MTLIKGQSVDEKFSSLEKILQSLRRRLSTYVINSVSPQILMLPKTVPDVNRECWSFVVPINGNISGAQLVADLAENKACELIVGLMRNSRVITETFNVKVTPIFIGMDIDIMEGDVITISVGLGNMPTSIIASLVFTADQSETFKNRVLLESLKTLEDELYASESK